MFRLTRSIFIFISLIAMFSCNNDFNSVTSTNDGVEVSIPTLSSDVKSDLLKSAISINSRAILGSQLVEYTVSNNDLEVVTSSILSDDFEGTDFFIDLEPGDYSISVEVFNTEVSSIDPVVSGDANFSVTAGNITQVDITAKPVSPSIITESDTITLDSSDFIPTYIDQSNNEITMGSEKWYQITPESDKLLMSLDFEDDPTYSDFYFAIYDEDGEQINLVLSLDNGTEIGLYETGGNTFYIGVIFVSFSDTSMVDQVGTTTISMETLVPEYTNIPLSDVWSDISVSSGQISYFTATGLESGKTYRVDIVEPDSGITYIDALISNSELYGYEDSLSFTVGDNETTYDFYMRADYGYGDVQIRVVEDIPVVYHDVLVVSDEWQSIYISDDAVDLYSIDVTPGSTYSIRWDDSYEGSDTYSADVEIYVKDSNGDYIFTAKDSGYTNPQTFTVDETCDLITIYIDACYDGGSLGLLITEFSSSDSTDFFLIDGSWYLTNDQYITEIAFDTTNGTIVWMDIFAADDIEYVKGTIIDNSNNVMEISFTHVSTDGETWYEVEGESGTIYWSVDGDVLTLFDTKFSDVYTREMQTDFSDEYESDDTISEVILADRELELSVEEDHTLHNSSDVDYIMFYAEAGVTYEFFYWAEDLYEDGSEYYSFKIIGPDGSTEVYSEDNYGYVHLQQSFDETAYYYIQVSYEGSMSRAEYTLLCSQLYSEGNGGVNVEVE